MHDVKFDRIALEEIFDLDTKYTDEELQILWFSYERSDGLQLGVTFSLYERTFSVSLHRDIHWLTHISGSHLVAVRVLSVARNQLEIIYGREGQRYPLFLSLDQSPISLEPFDGEVIDDLL